MASRSVSSCCWSGSGGLDERIPDTASPYDALPDALQKAMDEPFLGDFDALVKRRMIRVGDDFNRTHDFTDKVSERGLAVMKSELLWLWLPALVLASTAVAVRRRARLS